ncbi:MAG: hypothetical protein WCG85_25655 [Polyangia bacterium]
MSNDHCRFVRWTGRASFLILAPACVHSDRPHDAADAAQANSDAVVAEVPIVAGNDAGPDAAQDMPLPAGNDAGPDAAQAATTLLAPDRITVWNPGLTAVGDIPTDRTTIYMTLSPSGGDDTAAIQDALNTCPANQGCNELQAVRL